MAASGGAQLVPPHTPRLHWGQGWHPGAKAAKTDLPSGKEFSGDPGDGDLLVAKHQQPVAE